MFSRRSLFATLGITLSGLVAVTAEAATARKKPVHPKTPLHNKHAKAKPRNTQKPATIG